jgi:hypothetical protein
LASIAGTPLLSDLPTQQEQVSYYGQTRVDTKAIDWQDVPRFNGLSLIKESSFRLGEQRIFGQLARANFETHKAVTRKDVPSEWVVAALLRTHPPRLHRQKAR